MKSLLLCLFCISIIPILSSGQSDSFTIAFGSCSDEDKEQILWDDIIAEEPDLFIWLGDNIYGDTNSYESFTKKYNKQKAHEGYAKLRANCEIVGVWDDHDYGKNDGGKEFKAKKLSQQAFCNFFDLSPKDVRRNRPGIYTTKEYNWNDKVIKLLLLDTRYFRDQLIKKRGVCQQNLEGTILGDDQWLWLEKEISNSKADIHIIASSIQFIPTEHRFEKWANFPKERERMIALLSKNQLKQVIILSGDRHTGEISKLEIDGTKVYEITSSSLTHGINPRDETNQYRIGNIVFSENYGVLTITEHQISAFLKTDQRQTKESMTVPY